MRQTKEMTIKDSHSQIEDMTFVSSRYSGKNARMNISFSQEREGKKTSSSPRKRMEKRRVHLAKKDTCMIFLQKKL